MNIFLSLLCTFFFSLLDIPFKFMGSLLCAVYKVFSNTGIEQKCQRLPLHLFNWRTAFDTIVMTFHQGQFAGSRHQ